MKRIFLVLILNLGVLSSFAQPNTKIVTHYIFPEFVKGEVLLSLGQKETKSLNYNALTEELVFDYGGQKSAFAKESLSQIDTVFVNQRKFVVVDDKLMELLHHSSWNLFAEYKCDLKQQGGNSGYGTSQTASISSISSLQNNGAIYDLKLPNGYDIRPYTHYWLKRNGQSEKFSNIRQLKKIYKDKKDAFNDYTKSHNVDFERIQTVINLIAYLESN